MKLEESATLELVTLFDIEQKLIHTFNQFTVFAMTEKCLNMDCSLFEGQKIDQIQRTLDDPSAIEKLNLL